MFVSAWKSSRPKPHGPDVMVENMVKLKENVAKISKFWRDVRVRKKVYHSKAPSPLLHPFKSSSRLSITYARAPLLSLTMTEYQH